jgi:hypothetical protein
MRVLLECTCSPECPNARWGSSRGAAVVFYHVMRDGNAAGGGAFGRAAAADRMTLVKPAVLFGSRSYARIWGASCGVEPVSVYERSAHKSAPHGSTCIEKGAPMAESVSDSTASGWTRYIAIGLHKY